MSDSKIPAEWVASHKIAFDLFGVPSDELSRDELLAAVGWTLRQLEMERRNHRVSMDTARKVST